MQRSSLKNNLKPMHNLVFAICFSNMQILYSILSQTDFLPASSAQEVSNINSGQIKKLYYPHQHQIHQCSQNTEAPRICSLPLNRELSTRTGAA